MSCKSRAPDPCSLPADLQCLFLAVRVFPYFPDPADLLPTESILPTAEYRTLPHFRFRSPFSSQKIPGNLHLARKPFFFFHGKIFHREFQRSPDALFQNPRISDRYLHSDGILPAKNEILKKQHQPALFTALFLLRFFLSLQKCQCRSGEPIFLSRRIFFFNFFTPVKIMEFLRRLPYPP